jgi:hypothetical protein
MVAVAARAVQPPDLARMLLRQSMEHREGSGADAGGDEQNGRLGAIEDEGSARRRDFELVADAEAGVQTAAAPPCSCLTVIR